MAKQFALVAIELTDDRETDIQAAMESFADIEPEDLTVIDEADVPETSYKLEWMPDDPSGGASAPEETVPI